MAQNHITGSGQTHDLLAQLTTDELQEQIAYWTECQDREGTSEYAKWRYQRDITTAAKILSRRSHPAHDV